MAVTRIGDVVVPEQFTDYIIANTMERTALVAAGVMTRNQLIEQQLRAGADSFTVPYWKDLGSDEPNYANDDPADFSTPLKINSGRQLVRKAFLHQSWSAMNLASELAGSNAIEAIQSRASAYWERVAQRRLVATLRGILAANVANESSDMVHDISALTGGAEIFSDKAVIAAAGTLGDAMANVTGIAMHSDVYQAALGADLIQTERASDGKPFTTYRGLAVIVDDGMPKDGDVYTTALFAQGAIGYGISEPRVAEATEIENLPSAGNGGGQQVLHSRVNMAIHPAGYRWIEGTLTELSPTLADLASGDHWARDFERKAVPIAFVKHKV